MLVGSIPCHFPLKTVPKDPEPILWPKVIWPSGISQSSLESLLPSGFCSTGQEVRATTRCAAAQPWLTPLTILLRSSEDEDDLRSLCWHGDFCGTLTLVREPGSEAEGVADRPVVEPEGGWWWRRRWIRCVRLMKAGDFKLDVISSPPAVRTSEHEPRVCFCNLRFVGRDKSPSADFLPKTLGTPPNPTVGHKFVKGGLWT